MTTMITNKFVGVCVVCKNTVTIGSGVAFRNAENYWRTKCYGCRHLLPAAAPVVVAKPADNSPPRIVADLVTGAADDLFCEFSIINITDTNTWLKAKDMLKGTIFRKGSYFSTIVVGDVICKRFDGAGIRLDVLPALAARLQVLRAQHQQVSETASQFLIDAEKRLAATGKALMPFQRTGIVWLAPLKSAILADEMGLGKTLQALVAAPLAAAMLVIGPASSKGVWPSEAALWRPDLTPVVLEGKGSFRWPGKGEMVFITYGCLPVPRETCEPCAVAAQRNKPRGDCPCIDIAPAPMGVIVVADEYHNVKNPNTARTIAFRGIARRAFAKGGKVWGLTGTPVDNKIEELFSLADNLGRAKQAFGTRADFDKLFQRQQTKFGPKYSAKKVDPKYIGDRLREFVMRRKKVEVMAELPAKTVTIRNVDLDRASSRELDQALAELAKQGIDIAAVIRATRAKKADGEAPDQGALFRMRALLATAKTAAALEIVHEFEANNEPLIVFSAHRGPVLAIGKRPGWATITGDIDGTERGRIAREMFQKGKLKGIAGTIAAMGEGLTLTRSCTVLIIDPDWRVGKNLQAEDRAYRIGQDRSVQIIYLRANHAVDTLVFKMLDIKRDAIARTVDAATRDAAGNAVTIKHVQGRLI